MSKEQNDEFLPDDELMEDVQMDDLSPDGEFAEDGALEEIGGDEITDESAFETSDEVAPASEEEVAENAEDSVEKEKPIMYRPPRMDLYTVLLVLSLLFVLLATAIHYLECPSSEYGTVPFKKSSPKVSAPN